MDFALQAFLAALFTSIGALVVWFFQSRAEKLRRLEEGLRERRLKLYSDVMDPFVRLFAGLGDAKTQAAVLKDIKGYQYRKTTFDLTMFGSDDVVRAYNNMLQHIYQSETGTKDPREMVRLWALLLLAIRRSGGNPGTELDEWEMLASTIQDIESLRHPPIE